MPDGIVTVLSFFEDPGHGEGHQPLCGERQVEGERRWVVQRLGQILQEREDAEPT